MRNKELKKAIKDFYAFHNEKISKICEKLKDDGNSTDFLVHYIGEDGVERSSIVMVLYNGEVAERDTFAIDEDDYFVDMYYPKEEE